MLLVRKIIDSSKCNRSSRLLKTCIAELKLTNGILAATAILVWLTYRIRDGQGLLSVANSDINGSYLLTKQVNLKAIHLQCCG